MSIYSESDIDLLRRSADRIKDELEKFKQASSEPSLDELKKAHDIILSFCKEKKRKLYGGFALHLLLLNKDPNGGLYKGSKIPDIDIYSPQPICDMYTLCNLLFQAGFKSVMGHEALHKETYTIKLYNEVICDFSYVPNSIYHKMPYVTVRDLYCIHPNFMTIDYLRMLSNPLDSYWRFFGCDEDLKAFRRFGQLQKAYPLPVNNNALPEYKANPRLGDLMNIIYRFLLNRPSVAVIGFYAYNYFCKLCEYETVDIPYYEFVSVDYKKDVLVLLEMLRSINPEVTHTEFYPFFQYTDYSVEVYLGEDMICRIYGNNKRCIPYQDARPYSVSAKEGDFLRLGSFTIIVLYFLINAQKSRVGNKSNLERFYYHMVSHCIQMRNEFLTTTRRNFLDDTPFKDFVINCIGDEITADKQMRMRIESRKQKKKPLVHRYIPADELKEEPPKYIFSNSSGNKINNDRNLQLSEQVQDEEETEDRSSTSE